MPTLQPLSRERRARAAACLQMVALLLALIASAACLSGVASDASANGTPSAQVGATARSRSGASEAATAPRPTTMSAALLPEPGAWMMTTLGLLGLEWMARRKRVA